MSDFRLSYTAYNLTYTELKNCTNIVTGAPDADSVEEMFNTLMAGAGSEITELAEATPDDDAPTFSYTSYSRIYHR